MNKRGISILIATVLLIVITVAAIGIIWQLVTPLIRQGTGITEKCQAAAVELDGEASFYDSIENTTNISVSRGVPIIGTETVELTGVQIKVTSDTGDSTTVIIPDDVAGTLPGQNEDRRYEFDISGLTGTSFKAAVAPRIRVEAGDRLCPMGIKRSLVVNP